jgi:ribosome modulation factor
MQTFAYSGVLFAEGFLARIDFATRADDPYESGSPYSEAWLAGWRNANAEIAEVASWQGVDMPAGESDSQPSSGIQRLDFRQSNTAGSRAWIETGWRRKAKLSDTD